MQSEIGLTAEGTIRVAIHHWNILSRAVLLKHPGQRFVSCAW